MTAERFILGLMSGTSLDGVDCALCACWGRRGIRLVRGWTIDFPKPLHRRLRAAAAGETSSWETGQLHHDLGRFYAAAAGSGLRGESLNGVGLHGQTIFHRPPPGAAATFQIGEPAYLAAALSVPVVSNFRAADLAVGGQGAPLATLFHQVAWARRGRHVAVLNLGGIANLTGLDWTDRAAEGPRIIAFDTGPANVLLDLAVREFSGGRRSCDRDGRGAARGAVDVARVERWLRHPYFQQTPPKSTGPELFGAPFWKRIRSEPGAERLSESDWLATLTELTARSIAKAGDRFLRDHHRQLPHQVILAGGGAANPVLVARLTAHWMALDPAVSVVSSDTLGWPRQMVEPAAFALLAHYRLRGWPGNLPAATGARCASRLGQITSPP